MSWGLIIWLVILAAVAAIVAANWAKTLKLAESLKVFYHEVAFEMTKVVWPSQNEVINSTVIVLVVSAVATVGIMLVDIVLGHAVSLIFGA